MRWGPAHPPVRRLCGACTLSRRARRPGPRSQASAAARRRTPPRCPLRPATAPRRPRRSPLWPPCLLPARLRHRAQQHQVRPPAQQKPPPAAAGPRWRAQRPPARAAPAPRERAESAPDPLRAAAPPPSSAFPGGAPSGQPPSPVRPPAQPQAVALMVAGPYSRPCNWAPEAAPGGRLLGEQRLQRGRPGSRTASPYPRHSPLAHTMARCWCSGTRMLRRPLPCRA
mmetsp:Transcript_67810/g.214504  ORF Transcript_67810/g.214504 Transcript_67810/m.214504 type:complete len:226 (+) Transcript_67810:524-1201(+)